MGEVLLRFFRVQNGLELDKDYRIDGIFHLKQCVFGFVTYVTIQYEGEVSY